MKKILAVLLSVLCIFSMLSVSAFAVGDIFGDLIGFPKEEDDMGDQITYGVFYEMEPLSTVSIMYKPNPSFTFSKPVITKVTTDTPLSIDYQFVCWRLAGTNQYYYPGDEIEVTGKVTLYAVWEEKSDDQPRIIRVITTALETLNRLIKKFLGIFEIVEDFESQYFETTTSVIIG